MTPVNAALFVPTSSALLYNITLFVPRGSIVQSRMHFLTLRHGIGTAIGRDLLNIRKYHNVPVLIVVPTPVPYVVVYRVSLLATPVEALTNGDLARLLPLGGLNGKLLLIE